MENIYHEWIYDDNFETEKVFEKFINWLSSEFILYQQEKINDLTVYFPNGLFVIKQLENKNNHTEFVIKVKSKCRKKVKYISKRIMLILNHMKAFQEYKIKKATDL